MYCALCNGWVTRWTPEGEGRPGHTQPIFFFLPLFLSFSLSPSITPFFPSCSSRSSFSSCSYPPFCVLFLNNKQRCKVVWYCNYPFLGMNSFLLSLPNYTVCVRFCLREKESQVSVPWAFLCLSLKTDGWRSASVSLASPVALDNNTLPRRSGGREQMGGKGCGWRGCLEEKKKKKARWEVEEDTAVEIHICSSLYLNLNSKQEARKMSYCCFQTA